MNSASVWYRYRMFDRKIDQEVFCMFTTASNLQKIK